MFLGLLAGLTTGALWGLVFVAPRMVAPFTAWDFTLVRYVLFGIVSVLLMAAPRFRPWSMSRRRLAVGFGLGGFGYVGYFLAAAWSVHYAGAVLPPLIIGTSPVVLAVIANLRERAVGWGRLALPLALVAGGILAAHLGAAPLPPEAAPERWIGLVAAAAALALWVLYGLVNAEVMRAGDAPDGLGWTGLQGLGAGLGALLLIPLLGVPQPELATMAESQRFLFWTVTMAVVGGWFATWCWMVASARLPMALTALLIVGETVFGLIYGLIYEQRLPTPPEGIGIVLQLAGVSAGVLLFARRRPAMERILAADVSPR